jgi:hypothetical protein
MLQVLQQLDFSENVLSSGWRFERFWYFFHCNILLSYLIPRGADDEACVSDSQPRTFVCRNGGDEPHNSRNTNFQNFGLSISELQAK